MGHYILDAEQAMGATKADQQTLERILVDATKRIRGLPMKTAQDGRAILERIGITLMVNDFISTKREGGIDLFYETLRTKEMDCETSAFLYMSVADHAKLPLHAVVNHPAYKKKADNTWEQVPGHVFLRWHVSDTQYFNWEGRDHQELADSFYHETRSGPRPLYDYEIRQGLWQEEKFQEQSPERFMWWALHTRSEFGIHKLKGDGEEENKRIIRKALVWNTRTASENMNNPEYFMIRGDIYRKLDDFNAALTAYEQALALHPCLKLTKEALVKRSHCWIMLEEQMKTAVSK